MIMNTLVRILTSFLVLSQSISSSYFTSSPCRAASVMPRSGSGTVNHTTTAKMRVGIATTTNGDRHPHAGPIRPAINWPSDMPPKMATCTSAATKARWCTLNRSPSSENIKGKMPPSEIPVSSRSMSSCQYCVTKYVAAEGAFPAMTTHKTRLHRLWLPPTQPMTTAAGAPARKNAAAIHPPRYWSFSTSLKPKSLAMRDSVGASRF
mmetsp:Transcript_11678/g.35051  ORF Transcript_11678/g.35051 Transcript_11678/m.35051 type:complete len:207 (-) Transcript_11678:712-1332(-)